MTLMTKAGDSELVLTADASSSPNIDKFVITAKEVSAATYKITATAGEHGKIEGVTGVLAYGRRRREPYVQVCTG